MRLRNVHPTDVDAYRRIRCDPAMMTELGGPQPQDAIEDMVRRHTRATQDGTALICMIIPADDPNTVAGTVALTTGEHDGATLAEIGWAVLTEFQGQGLAKAAVRMLLDRARTQDRWRLVHAFPAVTNAASNAVCRSTGFTLVGPRDTRFAGKLFRTNHWRIDVTSPRPAP